MTDIESKAIVFFFAGFIKLYNLLSEGYETNEEGKGKVGQGSKAKPFIDLSQQLILCRKKPH